MFGTDYFKIVHGEPQHVGELTVTASADLERGTMMNRHASAPLTHCEPGTSDALGYLTKEFTEDGPSFEDMNFNVDLPGVIGTKGTIAVLPDGSLIEVEGEPATAYNAASPGLLVTTGTGSLSSGTALGTALSVQNGRWREAQTNEQILGILRGFPTPEADSGNLRVLIEIRRGGIK